MVIPIRIHKWLIVIEWDLVNPRNDMFTLVRNLKNGFLATNWIMIRSESYDMQPRGSQEQYEYNYEI